MILKLISTLLTGGLVERLGEAYRASKDATTDQARIAADAAVALEEQRVRRVLAGGRLITWLQGAWVFLFLVYDAKLIVWDKVLGWGVTDPLSAELVERQLLIMVFLFGPPAVRRVFGR